MNRYHLTSLCLWVFVFSIPWQNIIVFPGLGTATKILGLAVVGVYVLATIYRIDSIRIPKLPLGFLFLALLTTWGLMSYFWASTPEATLRRMVTWMQLMGMVWVIWHVVDSSRRLNAVMNAYILGTCVAMGYVFYTLWMGTHMSFRVVPEEFNPNGFAIKTALGLPMAWYLFHIHSETRFQIMRWIYFLYIPLAGLSIVLAASRGGLIVFMIASIILLLPLAQRRSTWKQFIAAVGIGVTFLFAFQYLEQEHQLDHNIQRLQSTEYELREGDLGSRSHIWRHGLDVMMDNPLIGIGWAGFRHYMKEQHGQLVAPHNVFVSIGSELGLIGLLLFLTFLMILAMNVLQFPSRERFLWGVMLLCIIASSSTANMEVDKVMWLVLGLMIAHARLLIETRKKRYPIQQPLFYGHGMPELYKSASPSEKHAFVKTQR